MLADAELAQDFSFLKLQYRNLVEALLDVVNIPIIPIDVEATPEGNFRGFDGGKLYVIESGSLSARYQSRTIYLLEEGDMLLPDITGTTDHASTVYFGSETGAALHSYPALEFMRRVFAEPEAVQRVFAIEIARLEGAARQAAANAGVVNGARRSAVTDAHVAMVATGA